MPEILPYTSSTRCCTRALAFYFWRTRWRRRDGDAAAEAASSGDSSTTRCSCRSRFTRWLLARAMFAPDGLHLGVGNAVSAILWLTVLIYWLGNFFYRLDGLQSLVMPVAAVAALLPALFPAPRHCPTPSSRRSSSTC